VERAEGEQEGKGKGGELTGVVPFFSLSHNRNAEVEVDNPSHSPRLYLSGLHLSLRHSPDFQTTFSGIFTVATCQHSAGFVRRYPRHQYVVQAPIAPYPRMRWRWYQLSGSDVQGALIRPSDEKTDHRVVGQASNQVVNESQLLLLFLLKDQILLAPHSLLARIWRSSTFPALRTFPLLPTDAGSLEAP